LLIIDSIESIVWGFLSAMYLNTLRLNIFCLFFCLGMSISCAIFADELPDLGSPARTLFSESQEAELGKLYMQYLRQSGRIIDDPIDEAYINQIGKELVRAAHDTQRHFYFFFFNSPEINSFAGPDGYIAVFSGLILATENEDELAAVMAHEIAHVTQGHISRKIADSSHEKYQTIAGMLAAIALGTVSGEAAEAALAATAASNQQRELNFSRQMEAEADRVGIQTLAHAGYNPNSMPIFFVRLQQSERYYAKIPELLSNHPLTPERISDAENRADQLPIKHHTTSQTYYLIKERMRVMGDNNPHHLISYYEKMLKKNDLPHGFAIEYGYALALQNNQSFKQALNIMQKLQQEYPEQLLFTLGVADIETDANDTSAAISLTEKTYHQHPDSYPVVMQYAYALYQAKAYQQALQLFHHYHLYYPNQPIPYGFLSDIAGKAGHLVEAYQLRASYFTEAGNLNAALGQLQIALKLPQLDESDKIKIEAQIKSIEALREKQK
jgi:beta-barrel assembly-enhancing protease